MPRAAVLLLSLLPALPLAAETAPSEVHAHLGAPQPLGRAEYRFLGARLYEATLFTAGTPRFDWNAPLALQLVYARSLSGQTLVDATMAELDRIEGAAPDHAEIREKLMACFRDVGDGDRYVAVAEDADTVDFWLNGRKTCGLAHAEAKRRLLGIWLSAESRSERLARQLRGE